MAFGPLGLAILAEDPSDHLKESLAGGGPPVTVDTTGSDDPAAPRRLRILHTSDLRTFGSHDVEFGELRGSMGLSVSADAIVLRTWNGSDDEGEPLDSIDARTDLVVGVPGDR